jgi:lysozyme
MEISEHGLTFIKENEGVRDYVYRDSAGLKTAGVGHLLVQNERQLEVGARVTTEQIDTWLKHDLAAATEAVNDLVSVSLTQNQFDALVDFVFNVGVKAFTHSTLLVNLNSSDFEKVALQLLTWVHAGGRLVPGLVARRHREKTLFETA